MRLYVCLRARCDKTRRLHKPKFPCHATIIATVVSSNGKGKLCRAQPGSFRPLYRRAVGRLSAFHAHSRNTPLFLPRSTLSRLGPERSWRMSSRTTTSASTWRVRLYTQREEAALRPAAAPVAPVPRMGGRGQVWPAPLERRRKTWWRCCAATAWSNHTCISVSVHEEEEEGGWVGGGGAGGGGV